MAALDRLALALLVPLSGCQFVLDFRADVVDGGGPGEADGPPLARDGPGDAGPGDSTPLTGDAPPSTPDATSTIGCADGAREGFTDPAQYPLLAGCSGGFDVPGLLVDMPPACARGAGDDTLNPAGLGCRATDLCAAGWHVCLGPGEVSAASGGAGCAGAVPPGAAAVFFATRQSGPGGGECGAGSNDLFGCGNAGAAPAASCAPLDRFSGDLCASIGAPWACGADGLSEALNVSKASPDLGGVLCCRD